MDPTAHANPVDARKSLMPASRFRRALPVLLLVVLALAVRLPHLGWGLPAVEEEAFPAKKALEMGGFAGGPRP